MTSSPRWKKYGFGLGKAQPLSFVPQFICSEDCKYWKKKCIGAVSYVVVGEVSCNLATLYTSFKHQMQNLSHAYKGFVSSCGIALLTYSPWWASFTHDERLGVGTPTIITRGSGVNRQPAAPSFNLAHIFIAKWSTVHETVLIHLPALWLSHTLSH